MLLDLTPFNFDLKPNAPFGPVELAFESALTDVAYVVFSGRASSRTGLSPLEDNFEKGWG